MSAAIISESLRQASHRLPATSASLASKACHQKGDISDWIDQGGTQAELETLVELTEPLGRAQPTEPTTHPEVDGIRRRARRLLRVHADAHLYVRPSGQNVASR